MRYLIDAIIRRGRMVKEFRLAPEGGVQPPAWQPGAHVELEFRQSGVTLDVAPGKSILDAMIEADIFVTDECKRGECGNCYAGAMPGEPLHRDVCLNAQQRAMGMMPCVCWARGRLPELDLQAVFTTTNRKVPR